MVVLSTPQATSNPSPAAGIKKGEDRVHEKEKGFLAGKQLVDVVGVSQWKGEGGMDATSSLTSLNVR